MYNDEFCEAFFDWDCDYNLWDFEIGTQECDDVFDIWCAGCEL